MRVRMLTLSAGPGGVFLPGREYELDSVEAQALCAGGYAVPVPRAGKSIEDASTRPPENAAKRTKPAK